MEALSLSDSGLGVSGLAAQLEIDKGNAHRILKTLIHRGYVQQDHDTKRYRASAKLVSITGAALRRLDVRLASEEVCELLVGLTGESVHVSQVTTQGPVYILQRKASFRVSVDTEIGSRPPMHATSTGKAILAHLPEEDRRQWLTHPLEKFTIRTLTSLEDLNRDLVATVERGYAVDDEEYNSGVRCVASPVFGVDGTVAGSLGVSGPIHRMDISRVEAIADQVIAASRAVTERLGGPIERHPASSVTLALGEQAD